MDWLLFVEAGRVAGRRPSVVGRMLAGQIAIMLQASPLHGEAGAGLAGR
jgi:hypothetical protein